MAGGKRWILVTCLIFIAVVDARTFFQNGRFGKRAHSGLPGTSQTADGKLHEDYPLQLNLNVKQAERFLSGMPDGRRTTLGPQEDQDTDQLYDCIPTLLEDVYHCRRQTK